MNKPTEKHTVEFYSPGTFIAETSEREIGEWDTREAARMATTITERYGARPFAFRFVTYLVAEPIPDGRGGTLKVERKELRRSAMHYVDGRVRTLDQVKAEMPRERTLIGNMEGNGVARVVTGPNAGKNYRWTYPFCEGDVLVDADGTVVPA